MPLKLVPYDPHGELKARAESAVDLFTREYNAVEDPGVRLGPDTGDRMVANSKSYRKRKGATR